MSQIDGSDAARALGALRKKAQHTCTVCGKSFAGFSNQRYCGGICQQAAYRNRHRDDLNKKRRNKYARQKAGQQ